MKVVGRYRVYESFAAGGMASIHFGKLGGEGGFSRLVAIKRMHPQFTKDPEFVNMFMDEARVAGRIQHPNVVGVLDVVRSGDELLLVMDYVHGASLSSLQKQLGVAIPPPIAARLAVDLLQGLHAAHEATGEFGAALHIVHRDVSPQNLLVGVDGIARVVDFGIAKAQGRIQETVDGSMKGKLAYFSPEQLGHQVDRRTDVFAASIVLWEMLRGERLFGGGDTPWEVADAVLHKDIVDPSFERPEVGPALGAIVMRGLSRSLETRFATAREMAVALEASTTLASHSAVGDWVRELAGEVLDGRRERIARCEELESDLVPPPSLRRGVEIEPRHGNATEGRSPPDGGSTRDASGRQSSTSLIVLATAGTTLGVAGIALAVAMWTREQPASHVTSTEPAPSARLEAETSTLPSAAPASVPASSSTAEAVPAPSASSPRTAQARPLTEFEKLCRAEEGGVVCNGQCYSGRNREHCGACNKSCSALEICEKGRCVTPRCQLGTTLCPNAGCTFVLNDPFNCGTCGNRCVAGRCDRGTCIKF